MAKPTTLDDIAESIADLTTMVASELGHVRQDMATEFGKVRQEMADGFSRVDKSQRETNERLARLEGNQQAHEADIKELYGLVRER